MNGPEGRFVTTHWSVVLAAGAGSSPAAQTALETLCRTYWYPVYAFVRRRGFAVEDAQDLTQEFFLRLLERASLSHVAREKGRFRAFLLATLRNYLTNEWNRAQTAKRGGGQSLISWDEMRAEERYAQEPVADATPESLYERRWALNVMDQALTRLRDEARADGKDAQFEQLKPFLSSPGSEAEYARVAGELGMTPSAVPVAVHRLRRRFGALARAIVAHTVAAPDEVEDELHALVQALSTPIANDP